MSQMNELAVSLMERWAGCRMDPHLSYGLVRASRGPLDQNVIAHGMSHDNALALAEMYEALKAITDCWGCGWDSHEKFCKAVEDFMAQGRAAILKLQGTVKV